MKQLLLFSFFITVCLHSFANLTQSNWRWRNNNGSKTSATWKAAQNTAININSIGKPIRLRIQVQNATGNAKDLNINLQYALTLDGPWRYITNFADNNAFRFSNTNAYVNDLASTTQQLTGSTNTCRYV